MLRLKKTKYKPPEGFDTVVCTPTLPKEIILDDRFCIVEKAQESKKMVGYWALKFREPNVGEHGFGCLQDKLGGNWEPQKPEPGEEILFEATDASGAVQYALKRCVCSCCTPAQDSYWLHSIAPGQENRAIMSTRDWDRFCWALGTQSELEPAQ
jgi:hypothetical protein